MTKAIAQRASQRRVSLATPPSVSRGGSSVEVSLKLRTDRARQEQQVIDAVAAVADALKSSPATPSQGRIEVSADGGGRGGAPARYRCPLDAAVRYVDGQVDARALLASYLEKVNDDKGAQRLDLDGPAGEDGPAPDDGEAVATISANFSSVGGCAKAEAAANPKFRAVTVLVGWSGSGRAATVDVKEASLKGGALPGCLRRAFDSIQLPRFSGPTRTIEYPIRLK